MRRLSTARRMIRVLPTFDHATTGMAFRSGIIRLETRLVMMKVTAVVLCTSAPETTPAKAARKGLVENSEANRRKLRPVICFIFSEMNLIPIKKRPSPANILAHISVII